MMYFPVPMFGVRMVDSSRVTLEGRLCLAGSRHSISGRVQVLGTRSEFDWLVSTMFLGAVGRAEELPMHLTPSGISTAPVFAGVTGLGVQADVQKVSTAPQSFAVPRFFS